MLVAKLYIFHEDVSCFFGNKVVFRESKDIINSPEIKKRGNFAWRTLPVYTIPSKRPLYSLVYINVPKPAWSNPPLVVP